MNEISNGLINVNKDWNELVNNSKIIYNESCNEKSKSNDLLLSKHNEIQALVEKINVIPSTESI